jgi:NAD/NADP transhydrogenase alpha subunit
MKLVKDNGVTMENPNNFTNIYFSFIYLSWGELITKVPSTLHTPLMSGANAISGITLVGAILSSGSSEIMTIALGTAAVFFASINVVGGYLVTNRMLGMFKKK